MTVTTAPSFTITPPVTFPPAGMQGPPTIVRTYDILDATRFVGLAAAGDGQSAAAAAPQVHVVPNWFDELKARVPIR